MRGVFLLGLLSAALLACAGLASATDVAVRITASGFNPASVTIQNGDTVVWTNTDKSAHQIVADNGSFRSDSIPPGGRYEHQFLTGGTYAYHDAVRTNRRGSVIVRATRSVTIDSTKRVLTYNNYVVLSGSVSSGKAGEQVVIRQKPQGVDIYLRVTTVTTTDNGLWRVRVRPRRNTVYQAVWQNVPSADRQVFVKPLLRLTQSAPARFVVGLHAQQRLHARVVIQRWSRAKHRWFGLKTVRLTIFRGGATSMTSIAVFRLSVRHGTIIRAFVARNQLQPAYYGPAWSRALRA
jgi:plastocyanin